METDRLHAATSFNVVTSAWMHTVMFTLDKNISLSANEDITEAKMLPQHSTGVGPVCLTCRGNSGTQGVQQKQSSWSGQKEMSELICVHVLQISLADSVAVRSEDQTFPHRSMESRHFPFIHTKDL